MALNKISELSSTEFFGTKGAEIKNVSDSNFSSVFETQGENKEEKLSAEDKKKKQKAEAYVDLMKDVTNSSQSKPVVPALDDLLKASIGKLQGIIEAYTSKAVELKAGLGTLKPGSSEYEKKVQEINNELKSLKEKAKNELDNIYNVIHALEEVSGVLISEYGQDGAKTAPVNPQIKTMLSAMLNSTGGANPKEMKKNVEEFIKKFTQQENEKKENGSKKGDGFHGEGVNKGLLFKKA